MTWTLGSGVHHQQVGNTWTAGDNIVSLSMSGDLNIFDKRVGDKPARVLYVRHLILLFGMIWRFLTTTNANRVRRRRSQQH